MPEFIATLRSQPLAQRLAEIDKTLDKLATKQVSQATIAGQTYTQASIKGLRDFRDYTEQQYRRALAREGGGTEVRIQM